MGEVLFYVGKKNIRSAIGRHEVNELWKTRHEGQIRRVRNATRIIRMEIKMTGKKERADT